MVYIAKSALVFQLQNCVSTLASKFFVLDWIRKDVALAALPLGVFPFLEGFLGEGTIIT